MCTQKKSDETTPECILYSCVHDRMHYVLMCTPWVLLCTQLAYIELAFENSSVHKTSAFTSNRICPFYESNESVILSLSQVIKIIGKYISLCNSFTLSCISSHLLWIVLGTVGISHLPHCSGNWVAMAARVKPQ